MIDNIITCIIGLMLLFAILLACVALVFAVLGIDKYDIQEWLNKKGK